MHIVYSGLLVIICLGITVECQGGGGGGGGGGSFSGGSHTFGSSGRFCRGSKCPSSLVVWASVLGSIGGLILIVLTIHYVKRACKGKPASSNQIFVQESSNENYELKAYDNSIFKSGYWKSRYLQYGHWHGPHQLSLVFNSMSMNITGSGSDDVGAFTIDGVYSIQTQRIALTKTYKRGTGNLSENLGHQVVIQLLWNAQTSEFEGKWYVQTHKYHGDDKFTLSFDRHHIEAIYQKV